MRYIGGKARLGKEIYATVSAHRKDGQTYVEPFLGYCNVFMHAQAPKIGNDINKNIIAALKALKNGWNPP
jgi:site-specific DNA-adenine methylase